MGAAVLTAEQIGVHGDRAVAQVQTEDLIGQGEEAPSPPAAAGKDRGEILGDKAAPEQFPQAGFRHSQTHMEPHC